MAGSPVPVERLTLSRLVENARTLARRGRAKRVLLGIVGAPGSGKSTLSGAIAETLGADTVVVGMDGFHLDNPVLEAMGRRQDKGALDTFDVDGYVALLERLRKAEEPITYGPRFDRSLEMSIGSAIGVADTVPLVVTEGLYLLQDTDGWERVKPLLDEVWFVELDDAERQTRLINRRLGHGDDPEHAADWVKRVDQANAERVNRTRNRADRRVYITDEPATIEEPA